MNTIDYKLLFENLPGLYMILTPDLAIATVSDAYAKATLTQRNDIVGRNLFDVFPDNPDDLAADGVSNLRASLQKVLSEKQTHVMSMQRYDVRRPDGTFVKKYWNPINQPLLNAQGEVEFIIHSVEDVTELYQSDRLFFYLFEHNPLSIAISNIDTSRIMNVNSAFLRLFGLNSKEEVVGKTAAELGIFMNPEQRSLILDQVKKEGKSTGVEGQIRLPDNTTRWTSTYVHTVEVDNSPCMLAVSMDITGRKEQEHLLLQQASRLKQANEELETFSYSVSHDLKAPLRSLEGFSKLLIEEYSGKLDADANRWLSFISSNANRMGVLINDILNFSRISRSNVNKSKVSMNALVTKAFESEQLNYPGKIITFEVAELGEVYGDPTMLSQVWQNLMSNAFKYSSKNESIHIEISSKTENGFLVYSIKDHGAGFDEKYKEKLFGVFQRLHRSEEFEGTGVGLAIVNRIIQKHDGWITASSILGKETEFVFALPIINPS